MLFHTTDFWLFLAAALVLFYSAPAAARRFVLLAASYFFYGWWEPWTVVLIAFSTVVDFLAGRGIADTADPRRRRLFLAASLTANLGLLGTFKYFDFFSESFARLLGLPPDALLLDLVLPIGISFYTFQSLSYTFDIYRGRLEPARDLWDFALFVGFFPQLVIGPIVRAAHLLPQIERWRPPSGRMVEEGIHLVLVGLVQKMVFADHFAVVSDGYFADPSAHPGALPAWSAAFAFSMQIYFDFAGYSNVARGLSRFFGFRIPVNFRRPFLATTLAGFWRRWHISLFTWFGDYVFSWALGGERRGTLRAYGNLLATMLLLGLWHGADWTFILFGGVAGLALVAERLLALLPGAEAIGAPARGPAAPLRMALNLGIFMLIMVVFRSPSLAVASDVYGQMFASTAGEPLLTALHLGLALAAAVFGLLEEKRRLLSRLGSAPAALRVPFYVVLLFALELLSMTQATIPYVYFQF